MKKLAARTVVAELVRTEFGGKLNGAAQMSSDVAREVIWVAGKNKLLKPVLKKLESLGIAIPQGAQPGITKYLARTMKNNAGALATTREVSKTLSAAGITHVAYKGPIRQISLAQDPFERPVTDVDILVKHDDFGKATAVLNDMGYSVPAMCDSPWWRHYLGEHHLFADDGRRWPVDLHHRTQQPSCPRPRDQAALMDNPSWIEVGGQKIATLSASANLLNTVMSVVKGLVNREASGAHVIDLARQLHAADEAQLEQFERAAREQGLVKSYAVARRCVMVMTGVDVGPTKPWFISDELLLAMLLTPDDPNFRFPQRRRMLWHLVDDETPLARIRNFVREFGWMAAAEISRRTHDVSVQDPQTK